jgi:hypothetical protein
MHNNINRKHIANTLTSIYNSTTFVIDNALTLIGLWQLYLHSYALDFEWPIMFKLGLYRLLMNYNMFVWKLNL